MTGAIRTDEDGDGNFDLELKGVGDGEVWPQRCWIRPMMA